MAAYYRQSLTPNVDEIPYKNTKVSLRPVYG
jgi:hypothetical protein